MGAGRRARDQARRQRQPQQLAHAVAHAGPDQGAGQEVEGRAAGVQGPVAAVIRAGVVIVGLVVFVHADLDVDLEVQQVAAFGLRLGGRFYGGKRLVGAALGHQLSGLRLPLLLERLGERGVQVEVGGLDGRVEGQGSLRGGWPVEVFVRLVEECRVLLVLGAFVSGVRCYVSYDVT